jgi:hypothetical protein
VGAAQPLLLVIPAFAFCEHQDHQKRLEG